MSRGEYFNFLAFQWDISKAKRLVSNRKPDTHIRVEDVYGTFLSPYDAEPEVDADGNKSYSLSLIRIDTEHALAMDVSRLAEPLIGVALPTGEDGGRDNILIDGWHRVYRAFHEGVETLPIYILNDDEELACRTAGELEADSKERKRLELAGLLAWVENEAPAWIPDFVRAAEKKGLNVQVVVSSPHAEWDDEDVMAIIDMDSGADRVGFLAPGSVEELIRYYR
jgi:hypothetical protein